MSMNLDVLYEEVWEALTKGALPSEIKATIRKAIDTWLGEDEDEDDDEEEDC